MVSEVCFSWNCQYSAKGGTCFKLDGTIEKKKYIMQHPRLKTKIGRRRGEIIIIHNNNNKRRTADAEKHLEENLQDKKKTNPL